MTKATENTVNGIEWTQREEVFSQYFKGNYDIENVAIIAIVSSQFNKNGYRKCEFGSHTL